MYDFMFGYRGEGSLTGGANGVNRHYAHGVIPFTGCPTTVLGGSLGVQDQNSGRYQFRSWLDTEIDDNIPTAGNPGHVTFAQSQLTGVQFEGLSPRLQFMMGSDSSVIAGGLARDAGGALLVLNAQITRGWVRLVQYSRFVGHHNILRIQMPVQPNLSPPSFLFLQFQAQGTRSKILGQADERGGWAIPTASNLYMSNYDNFPVGKKFSVPEETGPNDDQTFVGDRQIYRNVRSTPHLYHTHTVINYKESFANRDDSKADEPIKNDGIGFDFDPIVWDHADAANFNNFGRDLQHNFSATTSDHTIFGHQNLVGAYNPEAACRKFLYGDRSGGGSPGFGTGLLRQAPTFTVSMIEPNWLYTSMENTTVQTLDVQLLWGDTSETVDAEQGQPAQFSVIVAP